jgi:hypothetical protein
MGRTTKGSEFESRWWQEFSLIHVVRAGSGTHPASYPMGTGGSFPVGKAAGSWSWPLTSNLYRGQENMGPYIHSPIRFHGTEATPGLLCQPRVIVKMMWRSRWNVDWQGKSKFSEKTCPSATFVHHKIPHDQTRVWTRAAAVGSWRLTAWAMARPTFLHLP